MGRSSSVHFQVGAATKGNCPKRAWETKMIVSKLDACVVWHCRKEHLEIVSPRMFPATHEYTPSSSALTDARKYLYFLFVCICNCFCILLLLSEVFTPSISCPTLSENFNLFSDCVRLSFISIRLLQRKRLIFQLWRRKPEGREKE